MRAASTNTATVHTPVLVREVLRELDLKPGQVVVDGTVGGGGHARKILEVIGAGGTLIGLDRDPLSIARLQPDFTAPNVKLVAASYVDLGEILATLGVTAVDRILVDLGLSSDQLADDQRGFSFQAEGPLDLRFDMTQGQSAAELLASVSEAELCRLLTDFGEEPAARRIATAIIAQRSRTPLRTARQLATLVEQAVGALKGSERHPATRVFQALRIAVNRELEHVERALQESFPRALKPGGILAVISFHSLEDRLVKEAFRRSDVWQPVTAKPVGPSPAEERFNPRSRSAKLRAARRVDAS